MKIILKKAVLPLVIIVLYLSALLIGHSFANDTDENGWKTVTLPDGTTARERTTYFLTDHLGSTDVEIDENGNVLERSDYLPFGSDRLRIAEGASSDDDYGFTGREKDDETGLYYYGARYYDPLLGRFVSSDPALDWIGQEDFEEKAERSLKEYLSDPQNLNAYTYALNNPVKHTDPEGEIVPLLIAAWAVTEIALSAYDIYDTVTTVLSSQTSLEEKGISAAGLAIGLVAPGGGYGKAGKVALGKADDAGRILNKTNVFLSESEQRALKNFEKKFSKNLDNAKIFDLPQNAKAFQKEVPASNIPNSKAIYEKQVSPNGKTLNYTKTTYDGDGNIVHVKDKINNITHE